MIYTKNDYTPLEKLVDQYGINGTFSNQSWQDQAKVSIIIPTYNQEKQLRKQLLALQQQTYNPKNIEVVIADDGSRRGYDSCMDIVSKANLPFDVKYVWQPDKGFRLAKVRNEALKRATHNNIISLDVDMIPEHTYVENVMKWHYAAKKYGTKIMTSQDRAFIEPEDMPDKIIKQKALSEVKRSKSRRFGMVEDWRHERYKNTNNLKKIKYDTEGPFYIIGTTLSGGNCSFSRSDAFEAGLFDENFRDYGAEDSEFGLRLYEYFNNKKSQQLFFVPVNTTAYHLEHGEKINNKMKRKAQELFWSKVDQFREEEIVIKPDVSVYIPCHNQENFIGKAMQSVAQQNFDLSKLEVVIGEDGSTDNTKKILEQLKQEYEGLLNIRILNDKKNKGMAENTNRTIMACKGKYIVQLDPDDEFVPETISTLYQAIKDRPDISLVFGDCIDRDVQTGEEKLHWSCEEFTENWYTERKNKATTKETLVDILNKGMRIHHPRMFSREAFFRTEGANPNLQNAVDYDLYTKLVEVGRPLHIKEPLYVYNINHGNNTTNKGKLQRGNDKVVKRLMRIRGNQDQHKKEAYIIEEGDTKYRVKYFDLINPNVRIEALYEVWTEEEQSTRGTKLYKALIEELESLVSFFRWARPEISQQQLNELLELEYNNNTGNYYQATFFHSAGKMEKALDTLAKMESKHPTAISLEEKINLELRKKARA